MNKDAEKLEKLVKLLHDNDKHVQFILNFGKDSGGATQKLAYEMIKIIREET